MKKWFKRSIGIVAVSFAALGVAVGSGTAVEKADAMGNCSTNWSTSPGTGSSWALCTNAALNPSKTHVRAVAQCKTPAGAIINYYGNTVTVGVTSRAYCGAGTVIYTSAYALYP